jgi:hypothetical protein
MDTTWLESVGGVALGALIGSVPAGLAIRAENRRFESLGVAEYEAAEARDLSLHPPSGWRVKGLTIREKGVPIR